ncbi:hypothetical protein GGH94_002549 [Coemansia aciculifera]|uniref:Uncharacterized protein n=1 Tax=Coemansia aciculifera TaxID=417176 RepID=A0A9W8IIN3_9FUNG|nr:hypothetical protein GGH94_002549 [Coemansia aciculifera]
MASRRSSGRQGARRARNNSVHSEEDDSQHKPLPTPRGRDGGQQAAETAQERQRLMEVFGSYPAQASTGGSSSSSKAKPVVAATGSSGSSSHHGMEFASPSPPTSANASDTSSGHLPDNVHLSMPAMAQHKGKQPGTSKSAGRSRAVSPTPAGTVPHEAVQLTDRQRSKITNAYHNQFAHLLGQELAPPGSESSAPFSPATDWSFSSPQTITLEEMQQLRMTPRRPAVAGQGSTAEAPTGKWSQATTPSPRQNTKTQRQSHDRDSGLFGGRAFSFTSPAGGASTSQTPLHGSIEPIQELDEDGSWSQATARRHTSGSNNASPTAAPRPRYDVRVPPPETLARTPTLATRSPTPTQQQQLPQPTPQSRRRRATTASEAGDTMGTAASVSSYNSHSRSRSFGSSDRITLQQIIDQQQRGPAAPARSSAGRDEYAVPLIPPPPEGSLQFFNPFMGGSAPGVPGYAYPSAADDDGNAGLVHGDGESVTRTRIRHRKQRHPSSVASPASYTLSSAYSPSNAGSNLTYELTHLGVHRTAESPYPTNDSRVLTSSAASVSRRRSSSTATPQPPPIPDGSSSSGSSSGRRPLTAAHGRSESVGSSRVSSIRDGFEQRAQRDASPARVASPVNVRPVPQLTPNSRKVAQMRERIEEWQRTEAAPTPAVAAATGAPRDSTASGSSGITALGAQLNVGEIESVRNSAAGAPVPVDTQADARLVPLTPAAPRTGRSDRSARKSRRPTSKSQQALDETGSKYSMGTGQSSNIAPSLFGSDQSSFSTPLLSRLPHMSVPSDIASLRTTVPGEVPPVQRQSVEVPPAPAPSPSPSLRDSVLSAVSSPVSVGGRRKQSLVVDARSASSEILQGLQHVKAATPEIIHHAPAGLQKSTTMVLESPAVVPPAALSAEERRAWARLNPTDRPPLSAEGRSPSDSMDSAEMRVWDDKLRRRADPTRVGDMQFVRPQVAESPALASEPKSSGGILPVATSRTHVVHRPTPPASEAFRKDRVNSALATLEGGVTGSPPPATSSQPASEAALSVLTGDGMYSVATGEMDMSPDALLAAGRPASFRMGRHGSSPLNPYTGASSPALTGSGSIAPPLPTTTATTSGFKQRVGGRRKSGSQQPVQQQTQSQQPPRVAQTPLPRRWWRNIKESMYAPIPPLHRPPPATAADSQFRPTDVSMNGSAGIEALPARPVRRHSFSGSTDIEQQKITAALSPRENMRRKVTLVDRVRGLLRGNSRRQVAQAQQPPQSLHGMTSGSQAHVAVPVEPAATVGPAASVAGNWGPHNPFSQQSLLGHGRRNSIDTLSIHDMAEVDRHDMHSRLDHLLSPHIGPEEHRPPTPRLHDSIAASPRLGHTAASSKFSFTAASPTTPKPLPATPRHPSQPQVFTFPVSTQPAAAASGHGLMVEPSPVFKTSVAGSRPGPHPLPVVPVTSPVQEMVEKPHPVNMQHFSQDNMQVNTAQMSNPHQTQPQQQHQQPQSQSHNQHTVHDNASGPVVVKRPSLIKRITAGWRKPVPQPGLYPIAEEGHSGGHHLGTVAAQAAAAEAGAGLLGRLFHPIAGPRPEVHNPQMLSVPNVNVMQSPQAYPGAPHEISQVVSPRQQDHQYSSGSMNPAVVVSGPSPTVGPYDAANGSGRIGQTPLPGQQPPTQQLQPGFPAQSIYAAFGPSVASMPQPHHGPDVGNGQMPHQQPMQQQPHESQFMQPQGNNSQYMPPPPSQHLQPPVGAGPGGSKLMSMMSSIPLLGSLFAGKKTEQSQLRPQTPGPNQPPGRYDSYGHDANSGSYASTETDHAAHGPSHGNGGGGTAGNIIEKITGAAKWYHMPIVTLLLRETAVRRLAPLVGRYALRYPLVEAEEAAAARLTAAGVRQKSMVRAGALQAINAREFGHAAQGLRYSSLDQRLAGAMVPRFSRLRKYRRAPEVWDDRDAHAIGQRVTSRFRNTQARYPGEPVLRGGGGGGPSHTDSVPRPADVERAVDGHPGSGDRGLDETMPRGLAARIGRAFGFGRRQSLLPPALVPTGSNPYLSQSFTGRQRPSPTRDGHVRIIDDPFEDSDLVSLRPDAPVDELGAAAVQGNSRGLFGAWRAQPRQPPPPVPEPPAAQPSSSATPMFPPFSHLPPRVVDQIMHRVGEPRVFIGSAQSQLVPPNNRSQPGDALFGDSSPYRTGTEWSFAESVKFSSPYPTTSRDVKNTAVWARTSRQLMVKQHNNDIARWPAHLEIIRDYIQLLALVLGSCGYTKTALDSTVGQRWPWMIVAGVPETLGLLWADLATTTGKSIGFLLFFGSVALVALFLWSYGLYVERSMAVRQEKEKEDGEHEDRVVTYEAELVVVPSRYNLYARVFGRMAKRRRMHILYSILTTLYIPVVKLCMETIVWSQGYWPVPNPFRETDHPVYPRPEDGTHRDPGSFCYTTTMRKGNFNAAFVLLPLAIVVLLGLGLLLPLQVYQLSLRHMPRIPGWADGKSPGYRMPPAEQVSGAQEDDEDIAPITGVAPSQRAIPRGGDRPRHSSYVSDDDDASGVRRDDYNPMLHSNPLLQGVNQLNLINPEYLGYMATIYQMMYNNNGSGGMGGGGGGGPNPGDLSGMASAAWKMVQGWWSKKPSEDPYLGMEKDEAYQARLRDMKLSNRNRHLATVQYRRSLDTDTADYRFIYVAHYPAHSSDPARMLMWKFVAVLCVTVLTKDNCWAKALSRSSLDAGRNVALLLLLLLMIRSHHSHRPFFDPTANVAAMVMRIGILLAIIVAFPLFLLSDPLSSSHMGLCVALALANLCVILALVWLASSALPRMQVIIKGTSAPLTLSPGILVATNPYDPRLRRLLIERVWQDTWSAILLASRDFRLLPNHRIAFCRTRAHPPYMVNYIGFAAERHLENLHLYDAIGRRAYCHAIMLERHNDQRTALMDEITSVFTGPDMYFNPYATSGIDSQQSVSAVAGAPVPSRFGGQAVVGRSEVKSWFGKVYILHFPFMVCMIYDELPSVIVPIADESDLRLYLQQNKDPRVVARRDIRRKLRALDGQFVTLTYVENAGPHGSHHRYCLPHYAEENEQYLAQFSGRRRVLYRGVVNIQQHAEHIVNGVCNVTPGFMCSLSLTDEICVDDEHLVNNLNRATNPFRLAFLRTGRAGSAIRTNITQKSRDALKLNDHNRHMLGVTNIFEPTPEVRALFEENMDIIDARLQPINDALAQYQRESHAGFIRKRTGLTPSFHIDVFAPGPESYHVTHLSGGHPNQPPPPIPATPALFGGPELNGQWQNDEHGRLSYIPTMEQLAERLERFEENKYMRDLLIDHKDDITLLYERLRTLVPSESNDPVKFAWYIFWDDLYRRYAGQVKQFKEFDVDFNPLYPQAIPYYPLPRYRLERFLYERGLWKPLKSNGAPVVGSAPQGGGGLLATIAALLPWSSNKGSKPSVGSVPPRMLDEFDLDPMPVPSYVPGLGDMRRGSNNAGRQPPIGRQSGMVTEARVWLAGDGDVDEYGMDSSGAHQQFQSGAPAAGFIHSGLLNRLYAWLDVIAYGTNR